uniref:Pentatricopeptide repeat-containing protein n=1 Tax=Kalanchoe fedtschenkoi TaxID=63787 RepID=A0A7N0ZZI3_KALFE
MHLHSLLSPFRRSPPTFLRFLSAFTSSHSPSNAAHNVAASDEESYAISLRRCVEGCDVRRGAALHAHFLKSAGESTFVFNHLINMYVKCGDLVSGLKMFDEMPERNVVSWTALISGFVQGGCADEALGLFRRMHFAGQRVNGFTLVSAFNACSLCGDLAQLYQIYAMVVRLGLESNVILMNSFLSGLIRLGKLQDAVLVFDGCPDKDIVSWNAMMAGYLQCSFSEVPGFWYRMNVESGVKPDGFTFSTVLTSLAALYDQKMGVQVHGQLVKCGHGCEICVGNSLVDMYLKCHNLVDGFKAFHEMPCRDVLSWTEMASGCLNCGQPGQAITTVEQMQLSGILPNRFTLATLVNACANIPSLESGKKAHGLRVKLGNEADICVDNALLDMYAKCGCMDEASDVFRTMKDQTAVSWTTMIMGYAQNNQGAEAISCFDEMIVKGVKPNYITFICVLYACSQRELIDEAWKYFSSMSHDHGIDPGEDHYVCMVDLLGRSGRINEARELVSRMPFKPCASLWKTLVAACQVHGDVETGLFAAKNAMDLDEKDSSTYVLLSNMFASASNWDGVRALRELMETSNVKKMPGSSWMS